MKKLSYVLHCRKCQIMDGYYYNFKILVGHIQLFIYYFCNLILNFLDEQYFKVLTNSLSLKKIVIIELYSIQVKNYTPLPTCT